MNTYTLNLMSLGASGERLAILTIACNGKIHRLANAVTFDVFKCSFRFAAAVRMPIINDLDFFCVFRGTTELTLITDDVLQPHQ